MKKRLISYLAYLGMGQNAFEKSVGISNGSIANMSKGLRSDNLAKIAETYPELNLRWLLLGEGNMIQRENSNDSQSIDSLNRTIQEQEKTIALLRDMLSELRAKESPGNPLPKGNVG